MAAATPIRARFVGGPHDGLVVAWSTSQPTTVHLALDRRLDTVPYCLARRTADEWTYRHDPDPEESSDAR